MVAKGDEVVHDPEAGPVVTVEEVQRWDRLSLGRFVGLVLVTLIQDGLYVAVEPGLEPQTDTVKAGSKRVKFSSLLCLSD